MDDPRLSWKGLHASTLNDDPVNKTIEMFGLVQLRWPRDIKELLSPEELKEVHEVGAWQCLGPMNRYVITLDRFLHSSEMLL